MRAINLLLSLKTSILLVIEKNRTTISSVIKWLTNDGKKSKIDKHAMLLIDDESDRGSINTKTDEDLTTINKRIRELLKLFEKSTYVVYTATPFANVFLSIGVAVKTKPSKSVAFEGLSFWTANQEHATQFYLALSNHTNWQLFKLVCEDLINLLDNNAITQNIALEITKRLLKWKKLFASKEDFGLEKQMGLLGELHFLKETMECLGVKEALDAWVFDTQDFWFNHFAVEIKTHPSSKPPKVTISSAEQLESVKEKLYLATYALTQSTYGDSVEDLVKDIEGWENDTHVQLFYTTIWMGL